MSTESRTDHLARAIINKARDISRGVADLLYLVREFDRTSAFREWGCASAAEWLAWKCDLRPLCAREYVRVARALSALPAPRTAFEAGDLSYTKVRAITRIATPETEATFIAQGRRLTGADLERAVAAQRRTKVYEDPSFALRHRSVRMYSDDDGMFAVRIRLCPTEGPIFRAALKRTGRRFRVTAVTDEDDLDAAPPGERMAADAFMALMRAVVEGREIGGKEGERTRPSPVTLIVDGAEKSTRLLDGPRLNPSVAERLLCEAAFTKVSSRAGGKLEFSRLTGDISPTLRRALEFRDRRCRFPGCHNHAYLHSHHVRWRGRDQGPTDQDNLVLLCSRHHMLVHEGGFEIWLEEDGRLAARSPSGRVIRHTAAA